MTNKKVDRPPLAARKGRSITSSNIFFFLRLFSSKNPMREDIKHIAGRKWPNLQGMSASVVTTSGLRGAKDARLPARAASRGTGTSRPYLYGWKRRISSSASRLLRLRAKGFTTYTAIGNPRPFSPVSLIVRKGAL